MATKYVKFNARFSFEERWITDKDWAGQGIEHDTVKWNQANNWMVPVSDISDEAWPYIEGDPDMKVIELERDQSADDTATPDSDNPPPLGPSPGSGGSASGGTGGQVPGSSTGGTGSSG